MKKGEKVYKVRNLKNGGIYRLGEIKLKKEPFDWELVLDENEKEVKTEVVLEVADDASYKEVKEILKDRGVDFKGNAPKQELMKLLDES